MDCEGVGSNNVITCRDVNNMLSFESFDMLQVSEEGGLRIHPIERGIYKCKYGSRMLKLFTPELNCAQRTFQAKQTCYGNSEHKSEILAI